jgi:superoxide dismutase, Fe-Mn family
MPFSLPDIPFSFTSMAPWISEESFSFHHGKHHAGYVKKLNAAIEGRNDAENSLETVISSSRDAGDAKVFNSAAQHFNHNFFWSGMHPDGGEPSEKILEYLDRDFTSVSEFKKSFSDAAATLFGSGWTWLVQQPDGTLAIRQTKDAETPIGTEDVPLLTLDVWEHAYYIDHRNDRNAFIDGFWGHVNWEFVNNQLK